MPRLSMDQYLTYMKQQPRTYEWGAVLVYDRFKTNRLLAQEHIDNLDLGSLISEINFSEVSDQLTTMVSNLTLDRPILSFVNSNLGGSKARLSMNVVSGRIIQYRRPQGSSQEELVSYSNLDPLTAPTVRMTIFLNESNGGKVDGEGRVTFDLTQGESYNFEVSSWKDLNEKLGSAISKAFTDLQEHEKVWELNVLKPIEGQLNPTSFDVRTHSFAGAQGIGNASEEEKEEGAVIVGVAFDGNTDGNFPGQDSSMPYLLPSPADPSEPPYTMNLIYNNEAWLKNLMVGLLEKNPATWDVKAVLDESKLYKKITANMLEDVGGGDVWEHHDFGDFTTRGFEWPTLSFLTAVEIEHNHGAEWLDYEMRATAEGKFVAQFVEWDGVKVMRPSGKITFYAKGRLEFELEEEVSKKGEIKIIVSEPLQVDTNYEFWGSEYSYLDYPAAVAAKHYLDQKVRGAIDRLVAKLKAMERIGIDLNLLRLNGLLFRGKDVAIPRSLKLPGDLSLLGDLAPKLTTFAIEPLETVVSAGIGETVTLSLDPKPVGPVVWEVKPLKNESPDAGTITDGVYTPPAVELISGTHKRVVVTATASGHTSSALITIVPNSVSVFPYFWIAQFDNTVPPALPPRYVLVGGDIKNELTWSMGGGSKGSIRMPNSDDVKDLEIPEGKNVRIYVSPKLAPGPGGVEALVHLDRVQVSAGGLAQWIDLIVPWAIATGNIKATELAGGAWQLAVTYFNPVAGEEEELPPEETQWGVLLGESQVNPTTGVYVPGQSEGPYIIVAGCESPPGRSPIWGYRVLILSHAAKRAVAINTPSKKEV